MLNRLGSGLFGVAVTTLGMTGHFPAAAKAEDPHSFSECGPLGAGNAPNYASAADLDGVGDVEFAVADSGSLRGFGDTSVPLINGEGTFAANALYRERGGEGEGEGEGEGPPEGDGCLPGDCPDDGQFCNGDEYCDDDLVLCLSTGSPCGCKQDCDEETDTCSSMTCDDWMCDGDANGDAQVDPLDQGYILARFSLDPCVEGCAADVNCDGVIDPLDAGYSLARLDSCAAPLFCDDNCGTNSYDCCIVHSSPTCCDADCFEAICAMDPFCCNTSWDSVCVGEALAEPLCDEGSCGDFLYGVPDSATAIDFQISVAAWYWQIAHIRTI